MRIVKNFEFWVLILLVALLAFIYRDVFLQNKIIFPANFLATFYSPWATVKYPGYPNGIPHKPIGGNDNIRMFYPYRSFINKSLKNGEIPLWNPYNFAGSPLVADFQSAVFYPLNAVYFFLPQITAWSLLVVIQPLLATLFMYIYLRNLIVDKSAAFLGAFAFGFSGFIIVWSMENTVVGQSALWLPLIFFATDKLISKLRLKYFLLATASLSATILAGFFQVTFYIFVLSFCYGIFRLTSKSGKKKILTFFIFNLTYLCSLLISSIQLLPSIEALGQSAHNFLTIEEVLRNYLLPIRYFVKILAPDIFGNPATYNHFGQGFYHESIFYIGIIPLVFAALSSIKLKDIPSVKFFIWVSVISFLFGVKSPFTDWFYRLPIPITSSFTPSRIFIVTSFSLAVLSAYGFSYWLNHSDKHTRRILYIIVILFTSLILFYIGFYYLSAITNNSNPYIESITRLIKPHSSISSQNARTSARNIVLPLLTLLALLPLIFFQKFRTIKVILIIILVSLGQFYFTNKYKVVDERKFLYPNHFIFDDIQKNQKDGSRFLTFGLPILSDIGLEKETYSTDGIDPVFPKRYGELLFAAKNAGRFITQIPRIEANLSEYVDNENILNNSRRLKLISLLGVTRVYNYQKDYKDPKILPSIFPPSMFKSLWVRDNWHAYENEAAYPKAFFVDNFIVEKDPQKILNLIFSPDIDLRKTVILEEKPDTITSRIEGAKLFHLEGGIARHLGDNQVAIQSYLPQEVILKVNNSSESILFLSDNFYPGWEAQIDGKSTHIFRANYTFRAVVVPKGNHIVTFIFKPLSFQIGAIITLLTLLSLISILFYNYIRHKQFNHLPAMLRKAMQAGLTM